MPAIKLTDTYIRNLKPGTKQFEVRDEIQTGLSLRVSPKGTKTFYVMYRHYRKQRRFKLGLYGEFSLREARQHAQIVRADAARGQDPAAEKAMRAASPTAFDGYVDTFIERYAKINTKRWTETRRILEREFVKPWGGRELSSITKKDVVNVLDAIVKRGKLTTSNRALAAIRKLFNWAVESGDLHASPCNGIRARAKEKSRNRSLSDTEIAEIWRASEKIGYPFGALIHLLFLTGQRRDEVASLLWQDIDFEKAQWSMPTNKSDRPHEVPLCSEALKIIKLIPKTQSEFIFPAKGNPIKSISGFSYWKRKLDALSQTSDWRLHDIRRTVATGMAQIEVAQDIIDRILNHKTSGKKEVSKVYNQHTYIKKRREALNSWERHLRTLIDSKFENAA